jgi:(4S)-4-hydroxy-5-phosphonooxypentane-2,3-dione isomerase
MRGILRIVSTHPGARSMSVTYVVKFQIVPGKYHDFLPLLTGVLDAMRHESTFVEAMLHADPEDANKLMLYETWQDHDDVVDVQLNRPYRQAFHAALATMLAAPRDISIWRCLRADRSTS